MKTIFSVIILVLLLFGSRTVLSQQPNQEWVARYFGQSNDLRGPYLKVDKIGNSYLAGTHVVNDSINIMVAKYNSVGSQLWNTLYKYPGEGYFAPMAFAIDTSGNAYLTSKYGQSALSYFNTLTVKFNATNGSVVWAKSYIGGPRHNIPEDIKIDKNNNIYIVGASDSALLCIKYNTDGDSLWVRKYQPPSFSYANACIIDDSLNIIITGIKTHCVSFPPPGACFDTLLTIKYSPDGNLRWAKTYSYPGNPSFNAGLKITNDQSGNIYVGGKTRPNVGTYKYLTLKYDRNGIYQWATLYDGTGSGDDNVRAIVMDKINNSVFITGTSPTTSTSVCATIKYNSVTGDSTWVRRDTGIYRYGNSNDIKVDNLGCSYITGITGNTGTGAPVDILTIKYTSQGSMNWLVTYNGALNGLDIGRSIELDSLNNVYVCGVSNGDYVIIKYSQVSGIQAINNEIPKEFKLSQNYPNPFNPNTKIKFSLPKRSFVQLRIFDALGRTLTELVNKELSPSEYQVTVYGASYASGVYFYRLTVNGSIIDTKKFVIIK